MDDDGARIQRREASPPSTVEQRVSPLQQHVGVGDFNTALVQEQRRHHRVARGVFDGSDAILGSPALMSDAAVADPETVFPSVPPHSTIPLSAAISPTLLMGVPAPNRFQQQNFSDDRGEAGNGGANRNDADWNDDGPGAAASGGGTGRKQSKSGPAKRSKRQLPGRLTQQRNDATTTNGTEDLLFTVSPEATINFDTHYLQYADPRVEREFLRFTYELSGFGSVSTDLLTLAIFVLMSSASAFLLIATGVSHGTDTSFFTSVLFCGIFSVLGTLWKLLFEYCVKPRSKAHAEAAADAIASGDRNFASSESLSVGGSLTPAQQSISAVPTPLRNPMSPADSSGATHEADGIGRQSAAGERSREQRQRIKDTRNQLMQSWYELDDAIVALALAAIGCSLAANARGEQVLCSRTNSLQILSEGSGVQRTDICHRRIYGHMGGVMMLVLYTGRPLFRKVVAISVVQLVAYIVMYWAVPGVPESVADNVRGCIIQFLFLAAVCGMKALSHLAQQNAFEKVVELQRKRRALLRDRAEFHEFLEKLLPPTLFKRVKKINGGTSMDVDSSADVVAVTAAIADLSTYTARRVPRQVAQALAQFHSAATVAAQLLGVDRIAVIGDTFIAASNLLRKAKSRHHHHTAVRFAQQLATWDDGASMRVGVHVGHAVGAVIGINNVHYCMFGEAPDVSAMIVQSDRAAGAFCTTVLKRLLPDFGADNDRDSGGFTYEGELHSYVRIPPDLQLVDLSLGDFGSDEPRESDGRAQSFHNGGLHQQHQHHRRNSSSTPTTPSSAEEASPSSDAFDAVLVAESGGAADVARAAQTILASSVSYNASIGARSSLDGIEAQFSERVALPVRNPLRGRQGNELETSMDTAPESAALDDGFLGTTWSTAAGARSCWPFVYPRFTPHHEMRFSEYVRQAFLPSVVVAFFVLGIYTLTMLLIIVSEPERYTTTAIVLAIALTLNAAFAFVVFLNRESPWTTWLMRAGLIITPVLLFIAAATSKGSYISNNAHHVFVITMFAPHLMVIRRAWVHFIAAFIFPASIVAILLLFDAPVPTNAIMMFMVEGVFMLLYRSRLISWRVRYLRECSFTETLLQIEVQNRLKEGIMRTTLPRFLLLQDDIFAFEEMHHQQPLVTHHRDTIVTQIQFMPIGAPSLSADPVGFCAAVATALMTIDECIHDVRLNVLNVVKVYGNRLILAGPLLLQRETRESHEKLLTVATEEAIRVLGSLLRRCSSSITITAVTTLDSTVSVLTNQPYPMFDMFGAAVNSGRLLVNEAPPGSIIITDSTLTYNRENFEAVLSKLSIVVGPRQRWRVRGIGAIGVRDLKLAENVMGSARGPGGSGSWDAATSLMMSSGSDIHSLDATRFASVDSVSQPRMLTMQ